MEIVNYLTTTRHLLHRVDDSIKVLKKNGFTLAEVQEFKRS